MKKLLALLVSGAFVAASNSALAASPVTTAPCYDVQGKQIACAPRYEGRSQATPVDGIDPLWAGGALLVAGGALAAGLALSNSDDNNNGAFFLPFVATVGVSP